MSTRSLLVWAALVAGAELAVRGYLGGDALACHGGAVLFAGGLAGLALRSRRSALRRLGLGAAALLCVVAAADAALSRVQGASAPPAPAPSETTPDVPRRAGAEPEPPPPESLVIAVLGGSGAVGAGDDAEAAWPGRLEAALRERFACERRIVVWNAARPGEPLGGGAEAVGRLAESVQPELLLVHAGPGMLEALLDEEPALRFPPAEPRRRCASLLGAALERLVRGTARERRWREALDVAVPLDLRRSRVAARYRALVLAARRRGIDGVLLTTALALAPEAPPAALREAERAHPRIRARILANRHHARLVRGVAGSYGLVSVDTRAVLPEGDPRAFRDLARPSPEGHARIADAVADGLARTLARPPARCRPAA